MAAAGAAEAAIALTLLLALVHTAAAMPRAGKLGMGRYSFALGDFEGEGASLPGAASGRHMAPQVAATVAAADPLANYTEAFEVRRPVQKAAPGQFTCTVTLMTNVSFGSASGGAPFVGSYVPPKRCGKNWSKLVLTFSANSIGTQYDRIVSINIGGLEVLRSSTEEPSSRGVKWTVQRDITKYMSFLRDPADLVVLLGNYVFGPYTGYYNTFLSITAYRGPAPPWVAGKVYPISPPCSAADQTCLFSLTNGSAPAAAPLPPGLSRKIVRAQLEITPHHGSYDEFYYSNPPDAWIQAVYPPADWSQIPGGGVFREVQAFIDGTPVGTVWNYPVVFTGGVDPYFWRPVVGIGAFVLPSYTVDVTPFAALLLAAGNHTVSLDVAGIPTQGVWTLKAALLVWEDPAWPETTAELLVSQVPPSVTPTEDIAFFPDGVDANITTTARRANFARGVLTSSLGTLTWTSHYGFALANDNVLLNYTDIEFVTHDVRLRSLVTATRGSGGGAVYVAEETFHFPLFLYTDYQVYSDNQNFLLLGNITHGFNYDRRVTSSLPFARGDFRESLRNEQTSNGTYFSYQPGSGGSRQNYTLRSTTPGGCYSRAYSQLGGVFSYDITSKTCS